MIHDIDSILFGVFVVLIVWLTWFPLGYLFKNIKNLEFDFYRDLTFYVNTLKARFSTKIGKVAGFYVVFYVLFSIMKLVLTRGK